MFHKLFRHEPKRSSQQSGYTIIELMIATTVFAVVLTIIIAGVMFFSRSYYRGVNESQTQNVVRSIADTVTQAIQFNSGTVVLPDNSNAPGVYSFCVGSTIFVYDVGAKYNKSDSNSVGMYSQPVSNGCVVPAQADAEGRQQLLNNGMRVTYLSLNQSGSTYDLVLRVAYGDDDLLTANSGEAVSCKSDAGSEFCAVSGVMTSVGKRIGT